MALCVHPILWPPQALSERGLAGAFDAVVTSKDVPHAKPDPSIFLLAAGEVKPLRLGACIKAAARARAAGYFARLALPYTGSGVGGCFAEGLQQLCLCSAHGQAHNEQAVCTQVRAFCVRSLTTYF